MPFLILLIFQHSNSTCNTVFFVLYGELRFKYYPLGEKNLNIKPENLFFGIPVQGNL